MRAMLLDRPGSGLRLAEVPVPDPGPGEVLIRVHACGVCRTDLHVVDGELPGPKLPLVPGHEIVGTVEHAGAGVPATAVGRRVGVPWLGRTCGACGYCRSGRENLCDAPSFTGYQIDGGYAEYARADYAYCLAIPDRFSDVEAAPLLCAGLIGYRSWRLAAAAGTLGLYGFGAAAQFVAQVAVARGQRLHAFTRPGDTAAQAFARSLGAAWAGGSDEPGPAPLDAAILFAPVGALIPAALRNVCKGGRVVCAGIHMSDVPTFPYCLLWEEREVVSVANLTRADGHEFLALAAEIGIRSQTVAYPLDRAADALDDLRHGRFQGAAVLVP